MPGSNHRCERCLAWHKLHEKGSVSYPHGLGQCRLQSPSANPYGEMNIWPETTGDAGCVKGFVSKFAADADDEGGRRYG